jgi:hypothetical protein
VRVDPNQPCANDWKMIARLEPVVDRLSERLSATRTESPRYLMLYEDAVFASDYHRCFAHFVGVVARRGETETLFPTIHERKYTSRADLLLSLHQSLSETFSIDPSSKRCVEEFCYAPLVLLTFDNVSVDMAAGLNPPDLLRRSSGGERAFAVFERNNCVAQAVDDEKVARADSCYNIHGPD